MLANSYGIMRQYSCSGEWAEQMELFFRQGYALLDSGFSDKDLSKIKNAILKIKKDYCSSVGMNENELGGIGERHSIRCPLLFDPMFLDVCLDGRLLNFITMLMGGNNFILNQQNAVINPACSDYNQGKWHRDFPYQHFVSSVPLGVNALLCVDDFSMENGATMVLPGSHLFDEFPSDSYVSKNAVQITAQRGNFIVLNCMTYHRGAFNQSSGDRYAVNNVYAVPMIRRQVEFDIGDFKFPWNSQSLYARKINFLGMNYKGYDLASFLQSRKIKMLRNAGDNDAHS